MACNWVLGAKTMANYTTATTAPTTNKNNNNNNSNEMAIFVCSV